MLQLTFGPAGGGMGWLEWWAAVIGSTAWPIALVLVALIFRGQIDKLLKRIKGAKYGDAEVLFRDELDKIEEQIGGLPPAPQVPPAGPNADVPPLHQPEPTDQWGPDVATPDLARLAIEQEKFNEIAKLSPSSAVLNTWRDVELTLNWLLERSGLPRTSKHRHGFGVAMALYEEKRIDKETMEILNELKNLRNTAAHHEEVSLTDAFRFETLARQVIQRLRRVGFSMTL